MADQSSCRHVARGRSSRVRWLMSGWDHQVHAFPEDKIGEVAAEALCEHSALISKLTETDGKKCLGCLLVHGDDLAERHGEANRWGM